MVSTSNTIFAKMGEWLEGLSPACTTPASATKLYSYLQNDQWWTETFLHFDCVGECSQLIEYDDQVLGQDSPKIRRN